jgi:hypothetical protein
MGIGDSKEKEEMLMGIGDSKEKEEMLMGIGDSKEKDEMLMGIGDSKKGAVTIVAQGAQKMKKGAEPGAHMKKGAEPVVAKEKEVLPNSSVTVNGLVNTNVGAARMAAGSDMKQGNDGLTPRSGQNGEQEGEEGDKQGESFEEYMRKCFLVGYDRWMLNEKSKNESKERKESVSSSCSKIEFARGKRDNEDKDDDNEGETEFLWRRRREQHVLLRDEEVNEDADYELERLREENEMLKQANSAQEAQIQELLEHIRKRRENEKCQKEYWDGETEKYARLQKENGEQNIEIAGLQEEIFMKDRDIKKRREYATRLKESLEEEKGKCARFRMEIVRMDANVLKKESALATRKDEIVKRRQMRVVASTENGGNEVVSLHSDNDEVSRLNENEGEKKGEREKRLQKIVDNAADVTVNRVLEKFVKNMDEQNWIQRLYWCLFLTEQRGRTLTRQEKIGKTGSTSSRRILVVTATNSSARH